MATIVERYCCSAYTFFRVIFIGMGVKITVYTGSLSFLHSSIVHISYPPPPFLHPLDCARAFYYTFQLSFVSLLPTPIAHIPFAHIRSSTSSLLHSAFSTHPDSIQAMHHIPFLHTSFVHVSSVDTTRTSISRG